MIKKTTSKQKIGPLGNPLGNPLGFFNSQKVKRAAEPKQTLKKAQKGMTSGPFDENTAKYFDAKYPASALKFVGPYASDYVAAQKAKVANTHGATTWGSSADLEQDLRDEEEKQLRSEGWREDFNYGPLKTAEDIEEASYKRGGSTKSKMKKGGTVKTKKK